jgi:phage terminase large subunit GpA-like protein
MVEIRDVRIGQLVNFPPLPGYVTPDEILADALPVLDPPSRINVIEAAERDLRIQVQGAWQNFDRSVTPYMVEPSNMVQSRLYGAVAFLGPSQSGKTKMLETVAFHSITCDPDPVLIIHMTRQSRDTWVEEKLDPSILNSPHIHERLGKAREDSTFSRKRFRGMRLTIGYPTPEILSGGTYRLVLLTDVDHMPLVLGGKKNPEGSPFRMSKQRTKSFLSRGCVLLEGSPAYPSLDPSFRAKADAPHELPPVAGGMAMHYNEGTRARWYWECKDCGEEFEPRVDRLHYDDSLSPGLAGDQAEMECPHCHCLISHRHKIELNREALAGKGGWRHEAEGGGIVSVDDERIRRSDIVSYALNGAAATFANWRDIVTNLETAKRRAETLGDEVELAGVTYTEIGLPYSPISKNGNELGLQFLRDNAHALAKGVAPDWARFILLSTDVQGTYFALQATAYGEGGKSQVVDRIDLTMPPMDAPNAERDAEGHCRKLDPAKYIEDWEVLSPFLDRVWPVENSEYGLKAVAACVDFQGRPGVSDNAESFLKKRKAKGQGDRWFVTRGHGGWRHGSRIWYASPERKSGGGKARQLKILNIATDRIKDTISKALAKAGGGTGAQLVPGWMDDDLLTEFVSEERTSKGWEPKAGQIRNEGFDLSVMGRGLAEHLGLLRLDFDNPLLWFAAGPGNSFAVSNVDGGQAALSQTAKPQEKPAKKRVHKINYLRRG